jgi:hypothetical protein
MALQPGDVALVQEVWRGRVWAARPLRVVQDEGDFVALWFPKGTRWKAPTTNPERPWLEDRGSRLAECVAMEDWVFRDAVYDVDSLWLMRAGDWHAVWVSWLPDGTHWGWYVNLQEPFRRTELGFETMDRVLDLIIEPDRTWRWKDEDELELWIQRGVIARAEEQSLRSEGLRVIDRAERGEPPFGERWTQWRPDPSWDTPRLPEGWEKRWR